MKLSSDKKLFSTTRTVVLVAAYILLSGCATLMGSAGVNWSAKNPGALPDYETAKVEAEKAIRDTLKDPDSAQFRNWTPFFKTLYNYGLAGNAEALWAICAQVNAKNSYGGYAGHRWMYVKFRNGTAVRDSLGIGESEYDCTHGPADRTRKAS